MNNDTIYKQAAIDALIKYSTPRNNGDGTITVGLLTASSIKKVLNELPSAQPERKKGTWIRIGDDTFSCNKCGRLFIVIQGSSHMNFCPSCGTYMKSE